MIMNKLRSSKWWLLYEIGDIYAINTEIETEMWSLDYNEKVCYLPFVRDKKLIRVKNV